MVDEQTFPLYRLPYVALRVAFDCLDPYNILRLSMVSKKSYSVCKVFRKKVKNLKARFNFLSGINSDCMNTIFEVKSNSEVSPEDSKLESLKVKERVFKVKINTFIHILNFYCDDRLACLITLYEYLTDFYEVPLFEVDFNGESMKALDGVLARQPTLARCSFRCSESGDEEVRWFLDRIENRVTQCLSLDVSTSENFRLNLRKPIKTEYISFGPRFTLSSDNFNELNSRLLFAAKTSLTSENLNSYLKIWLTGGGNPNLGNLRLGLKSINVNTVLNGIEFIHRHHQNNVDFFASRYYPWEFNESYKIKRNDGTIASIVIRNGVNTVFFDICVWPDLHGNVYPELQ